jgi:hypothetical protein
VQAIFLCTKGFRDANPMPRLRLLQPAELQRVLEAAYREQIDRYTQTFDAAVAMRLFEQPSL